ncbi:peptidyl-prolyl cis-trans isomerase C [Gammaproteobacteria bacterium]
MYISKKVFLGAALLTATLMMGISSASADDTPQASDAILAAVNGIPIMQSTYDRYLATRPTGSNQDRKVIIEELVKREVLLQDAIKRGVEKQPEVVVELATLRENLLVAAALKAAADNMSSSDDELHKFYNDHLKEMTINEYKARHILVPTEEEAKAIVADLDKGADFAKLAKEKSKDNAVEGGDLGWFSSSQMVKPLSDAITTLAKGKYTTQPVHSEFGWHVLLHEDTREMPPPPFESVKDRIKMVVQRTKLQEHIQHLRNQAKVEIKE